MIMINTLWPAVTVFNNIKLRFKMLNLTPILEFFSFYIASINLIFKYFSAHKIKTLIYFKESV